MQHSNAHQEPPQNLEMSLREHLLAAGASDQQQHTPYPPPPAPSNGGTSADHPYQPSGSDSPHEHHLDPTMSAHPMPYTMGSQQQHSGDADSMQGTPKGKRELSTSKRAAQNRAAQRAFRQRKEGYIKKLEDQVKACERMEEDCRVLRDENFQLREHILILQTRLLETKGELPAAPPEMRLTRGGSPGAEIADDGNQRVPQANMTGDAFRDTEMQAVAEAADAK